MSEPDSIIATNLRRVRSRIEAAAARAGRDPAAVRLVAVSKTQSAGAVISAYAAGQREFGENRVQEAEAKIAAVAAADVQPIWHLIGRLQTNKARSAVRLFALLQSVDSLRLARALSRYAAAPLPVLLEVNVAQEASKAGFSVEATPAALANIAALPWLEVRGLMTVAPAAANAEFVRPVFAKLATLGRRLDLPELSMGMSGDFEVAIEEGATIVRIGSAVFGARTVEPDV